MCPAGVFVQRFLGLEFVVEFSKKTLQICCRSFLVFATFFISIMISPCRSDYVRTSAYDISGYRSNYPRPESSFMKWRCYSCMSKQFERHWPLLADFYLPPANFTDACDEPFKAAEVMALGCSGPCVTMSEAVRVSGFTVGHMYIRGCMNRILKQGFNETGIMTHQLRFYDRCRTLDRQQILNKAEPNSGLVKLCACHSERCNGASESFGESFLRRSKIFSINWILPVLVTLFSAVSSKCANIL